MEMGEYTTSEWVTLYQHVLPPGENIPVTVDTSLIDDSVPDTEDIK